MRKLVISSAVSLALGACSFAVNAADTATLTVTGTITPSACDVALSTASLDVGKLAASDLSEAANDIKPASSTLSVSCDASTTVALQVKDDRSASAYTLTEFATDYNGTSFSSGVTDSSMFGLGTDSASNKVGMLLMAISDARINSATGTLLSSADKTTWTAASGSYILSKDGYISVASGSGSSVPASLTTAAFTLQPMIYLKKGDKYPSGEEVKIDGSVTFSVVYL